MLSIVIADDETGIIDLCKMLIEYPGAAVIGEAHNGVELFEKIGELRPNAVITDISMPGMTGLELIERARTSYPEVNFIVMSGYTDFEYVQSALRLGVWDYLLKPLNKKELNRILKKLDEHIESVQTQTRQQEMIEGSLQESLSMLRERYIREVWQKQTPLPVPRIGETRILPEAGPRIQCLLFCVDNLLAAKAASERSLFLQAESAMEQIAAMEAEHGAETVAFSAEGSVIHVLIYPPEAGEEELEDLLKGVRSEIRKFNSQSTFVRMTGAVSIPGESWDQLPELMAQSRKAIKWRLEKNQAALIRFQVSTAAAVEGLPLFSKAAALQEAVTENRMNELCQLIEQAWERADSALPGSGFRVMEELIDCLNKAFQALPGAESAECVPVISAADVLYGDLTPLTLARHMQDYVREALQTYHADARQRENSVISQAKQYVQQHLAEEISLNDVARQVYLSPAYFSTLFKTETGCGFVKYLQKTRVEQAKKLLKNPGMRIRDIAEAVGYRDVKFFNKVFLNETSVTPSEYRRFYS